MGIKISALTETTTPTSVDMLPILTGGQTKKISQNNLHKTDTISELTSGAGVTVDGVLIKDSRISMNNISFIGASAYLGSAQNVNTGEVTKLNFDTEFHDVGGMFDTANKKFVVSAGNAGYYRITLTVNFGAGVDQKYYVAKIYYNNASVKDSFGLSSGTVGVTVVAIITKYLAENDYIEGYAYHNAGVAQGIDSGTIYSRLDIEKLGSA